MSKGNLLIIFIVCRILVLWYPRVFANIFLKFLFLHTLLYCVSDVKKNIAKKINRKGWIMMTIPSNALMKEVNTNLFHHANVK